MTGAASLARATDDIATLIERGEFSTAVKQAAAHLQRFSQEAEIWRLQGIALLQLGEIEQAMQSLRRAHALAPDSAEVLCNLASAETRAGRIDDAERTLERALALAPDHAGALNNLGRLRLGRGDPAGAEQCFRRCVEVQPAYAEAWLNLANAKQAQSLFPEAEAHTRHALTLNPRSVDGWYLLGYLLERQGRLRDAGAAYRTSMDLDPRPRTAHNLGLVLDQLGDWQGSAHMFERALELEPGQVQSLSHLVLARRRLCDWSDLAVLSARLIAAVDAQLDGITPFSFLAEDATPAQQLACARLFARQFERRDATPERLRVTGRASDPDASIRVGFVSSGFSQHATGLLVVELIERLRTSSLTTIGFATTPDDRSEIRARLGAAFHQFHDVSGRAPAQIADSVRSARCAVLIDIDGYCMGSVPQLFALRPAPIQVNWLAYPGSLGAAWYDYLIADHFLIPDSERAHYDEKIAWLPRCYQPTDTTRTVGEPPARAACGLPQEGFVYCCFNNSWKFSPHSFALWMRILRAVPASVLWLLDGPSGNGIAERLRESARRAGIDPQRLLFSAKLRHPDYLARFRHAGLFLDTNPYNAHTTASDALYAGCPVLTRPGNTFASRVAGSLNHQLGLDEMTVDSDDAYVARAIELATQPLALAEPQRRARLFDMQAYARDFAQLLMRIDERARRGEAARDISL